MRAAQKGLKMSCIDLFGHHNGTRIMFGKPWFLPVFEPVVPNWPNFKAQRAKIAPHGLKMGAFHLFVQAKKLKSILGKTCF